MEKERVYIVESNNELSFEAGFLTGTLISLAALLFGTWIFTGINPVEVLQLIFS